MNHAVVDALRARLKSCHLGADGYDFGSVDPLPFVQANLLREKIPGDAVAREWKPSRPVPVRALKLSTWKSGNLFVISTLVVAELPDGSERTGLQWHLSVSDSGKRATDKHVRRTLRAFEMVGAEEDNHHPGNARHFWRPLEKKRRVDCECKVTEILMQDKDGYRWSQLRDGPCAGCEIASILMRPCPIHGPGGIGEEDKLPGGPCTFTFAGEDP